MKNKQLLSFITINYNGIKDTIELIDSIVFFIHSIEYEIIVVDNGSLNNEGQLLQEKYPEINVIQSKANLGFSGGNNLGIKKAKGDYLFFINNDTVFTEDKLQDLIDQMNTFPKVGGASPKIKYSEPPCLIQFAGFTRLSSITIRNKALGSGEVDRAQYDRTTFTSYLHGAAMIIKREVIEKIGLMPEIYFLYYEEIDWCTQMTDAGYQLLYLPNLTIYHKESRSTGAKSKLKIFYMTRNRLLYSWRHRKGTTKWLSLIYLMTIVALKDSFSYIINRRIDLLVAMAKGIYCFFILNDKNIKNESINRF